MWLTISLYWTQILFFALPFAVCIPLDRILAATDAKRKNLVVGLVGLAIVLLGVPSCRLIEHITCTHTQDYPCDDKGE
jgi:hypothetical protein